MKYISRIKDSVRVLLGRAKATPVQTKKNRYCPVCETHVARFAPLSDTYMKKMEEVAFVHPLFQMETVNWFEFTCENCGAIDRDRLYAQYFSTRLKKNEPLSVLDIAPSSPLQRFLKSHFTALKYRSADLFMGGVDDLVDITNMHVYADATFDFVICSHVLEHIEEDKKAMAELYRVLKPGGKAIVMVPVLLSLNEDYQVPEATTTDDRWKHYAQNDHVRMYSKPGFLSKLSEVGFRVQEFGVNDFGVEVFKKSGIHKRSVLYIVNK